MKKSLLLIFGGILIISVGAIVLLQDNSASEVEQLRAQHQEFLDNSPFAKTKNLPRDERKSLGLPPNAYNEQMWELMMDPNTGRPHPERVMELQEQLRSQSATERALGDPWVDRGPNNQGGRTRGIMFDPNDTDFNRVFAGGVSGGLWVNDDITDVNSSWTLVPGIGANISVTVIISDPNDSNTFYVGAGESYTQGNAVGRGIWKSTDAGVTWANIFGGYNSANGGSFVNGIFYINDLVARDVGATTELYAAVASAVYAPTINGNSAQFQGLNEMGVYKSTNNGTSWTRFNITHSDTSFKNPNDIEIDINNNVWFTTTSNAFGNPGGDIYKSTDGVNFTLEETISVDFGPPTGVVTASRTELEPSPTDANTFWVAANVNGEADLFSTSDAFATAAVAMNEPNEADTSISDTDYSRNQAFYNLPIEADASGNLYVGGIDLFRSTDSGTTWTQISKWTTDPSRGLDDATTALPVVHADQHAIVFRPGAGNENEVVFGSDGGISYSDDITQANVAIGDLNAIEDRNKDYNTIQFYYGSIIDITGATNDDLAGGTQDNGTQFVLNATPGANGYTDPVGGDGGYTEYDEEGHAITTYPYNTHVFLSLIGGGSYVISTPGPSTNPNGSFINQAELDKNLNILYSNASVGATNRIERTSTFTSGSGSVTNTFLTDAALDANPSAFKVSDYTTTSTTLYVGLTNSKLLRVDTADATPSWNDITGSGFVGSISDIELGESEMEIFVTMHNYGVTSIWYSSDAGATWLSKQGDLPDLPVKCILQNPLLPQQVIIGTELGVWGTEDITVASPTWIQLYNGMSDVTVVDLDVKASDNTILAATHGRGFFTSQFDTGTLTNEDYLLTEDIRIYPKVSNGQITINAKSNLGQASIDVYNLSGQKVFGSELNLNNSSSNIDLAISSGIYILKITGDNYIYNDKIIIK